MISSVQSFSPKTIIHSISSNPFLKASTIISLGWIISGLINFFTYMVLFRSFSYDDYGNYAVLLSWTSICTLFSSPLFLYFVKLGSYVKQYGLNPTVRFYSIKTFSIVVCASIVVFGLLFVLFSITQRILVLPAIIFVSLWFLVLMSILGLMSAVTEGLLKGLQRFGTLSFLSVLVTSIKFILIILCIVFFFSLRNILIILMFCVFSYVLIAGYFFTLYTKESKKNIHVPIISIPHIFPLTLITVSLASLVNSDIILVRQFFPSALTGVYAGQMGIAKIILYAGTIVSPIVYTLSSERFIHKKEASWIGIQAIVYCGLFGIFMVGAFILLSSPLFSLLFNKTISSDLIFLPWMGLSMVFYSSAYITIHYLLSHNHVRIVIPVVLLALCHIGLMVLFHQTLFSIVIVSIIINAILSIIVLIFFIQHAKIRQFKAK